MTATLPPGPTRSTAGSKRDDKDEVLVPVDRFRGRLGVLDGWRAISILAVLSGHLLPLGPKSWQLNGNVAAAGMALFFTLSGFLIVRFLAAGSPVSQFLVRRGARILPLAWVAMTILAVWHPADVVTAARNFAFIANLPPATLFDGGEHLWSLCVEVQFYVGVALLCGVMGKRGLLAVPLIALGVTLARIVADQPVSIFTYHRVDEILAGGTLALAYVGAFGVRSQSLLRRLHFWPLVVVLMVCSSQLSGPLQYLRPYAAACLVGSTLSGGPALVRRMLTSRALAYIAGISYALYVIHGMLTVTWLGTGDRLTRYLKRPLLIAATFALADLSTRYFELPITRWARRLGKRASSATSV